MTEDAISDEMKLSSEMEALLRQCQHLMSELEQFKQYLDRHNKGGSVEFRPYQSRLRSELKALEVRRDDRDVYT